MNCSWLAVYLLRWQNTMPAWSKPFGMETQKVVVMGNHHPAFRIGKRQVACIVSTEQVDVARRRNVDAVLPECLGDKSRQMFIQMEAYHLDPMPSSACQISSGLVYASSLPRTLRPLSFAAGSPRDDPDSKPMRHVRPLT